jgi:DUF4097 and DUF4098 domain-containing protein YvlB
MANSEDEDLNAGDCHASGDVELDVPRGATLILTVRNGDADVEGVAVARIESLSGDTDVRRITKSIEVKSISGSIFLFDSSGRARLRTFSGDLEVRNARALEANDSLTANTTSGSVHLENVTHARIEAGAVSGDVDMTGVLTRGGSYNFKTHSGDVTVTLPADSSFKLNARVISGGDISNAFLLKGQTNAPLFDDIKEVRLVGIVGTGDAELILSSFNGMLQLRKK